MDIFDSLKFRVIKSSQNSLYAMLLIFLSASASIVTSVYATTLFLSSYPRSWLIYFLCAQAISITFSSFALSPALTHRIKQNAQAMMLIFSILLMIFYYQQLSGFWVPMFVSVVTGTIGTLCTLIAWNIIPSAFAMRKYKDIARYANQTAAAGVILGSLTIPLVLHYFSLRSLLLLSMTYFIGSIFFVYMLALVQPPNLVKLASSKKSPVQISLYRKIILYTLLIIATQSITDYLFKLELAKHFSNNQLGAFQGYYLGITNTLALLLGFATTKYLLKRIRLDGLLYVTQALMLLGSIAALVFPSLWTIALLASIRIIFFYNYASLAIEIILNFFPSVTRVTINVKIRTIITPVFVILVYLLLSLVASQVNEMTLLAMVTMLTIITFYAIQQVGVGYRDILQQEAEFRRFNLIEENYVQKSNVLSLPDSELGLNNAVEDIRSIPFLVSRIYENKNPSLFIKFLAAYPGEESETAIISLMVHGNVWQRTIAAKESRYRACLLQVGSRFKKQASQFALAEARDISYLHILLSQQSDAFIKAEINSRIQLATERALCWLAVATDPVRVSQIIPALLRPATTFIYQQAQEKALELLDIYVENRNLKNMIVSLFDPAYEAEKLEDATYSFTDEWLLKIIKLNAEGVAMDSIAKVIDLRQVELFKGLPAEILSAIAEETHEIKFKKGEIIFKENDMPDGLYCICSGQVSINRQGHLLNSLKPYQYFGELGLIDDAVRAATAVAETECTLLFLEKSTFDRITDDLPEVLRVVTKAILSYLRQNLTWFKSG
jgi:hypothetical protein